MEEERLVVGGGRGGDIRTDERQPQELEADNGEDGQEDPEDGLDVQAEPEEARVGGVDDLGSRLAALKHPLGVARGRVDLVPPAEADEAAARNVLEVVKVGGEEEDGDDEDHDPAQVVSKSGVALGGRARRKTHMLLMTHRPRKYTTTLAIPSR